jgi:hypothetical protein
MAVHLNTKCMQTYGGMKIIGPEIYYFNLSIHVYILLLFKY